MQARSKGSAQISIMEKVSVLPKQKGCYHAFPTLIKAGQDIWLACRSGHVDPQRPHGAKGVVRLLRSTVSQPTRWHDCGTLFAPGDGTSNELDAILSCPDNRTVFLATRDYSRQGHSTTFLTRLPCTPKMTEASFKKAGRQQMQALAGRQLNCFGHIQQSPSGRLLMPGYWMVRPGDPLSPLLFVSENGGRTWHFGAELASSGKLNALLTEYSLGHIGGEAWFALIRNENAPHPLMCTTSADDGKSWSNPTPTALYGHAPMILKVTASQFLVLYRDLAQKTPGIGLGISEDQGLHWQSIGRVASYQGNLFDGGYGDIIALGASLFLAVYFLADRDQSPWIEAALLRLQTNSQGSEPS